MESHSEKDHLEKIPFKPSRSLGKWFSSLYYHYLHSCTLLFYVTVAAHWTPLSFHGKKVVPEMSFAPTFHRSNGLTSGPASQHWGQTGREPGKQCCWLQQSEQARPTADPSVCLKRQISGHITTVGYLRLGYMRTGHCITHLLGNWQKFYTALVCFLLMWIIRITTVCQNLCFFNQRGRNMWKWNKR